MTKFIYIYIYIYVMKKFIYICYKQMHTSQYMI